MSTNVFREVRERLDIKDVARFLGLNVSRSGFIPCPLHSDQEPSCKLYKDRFFCFGCQTGGDSVDLTAAVRDISKLEAAKLLNDNFALGIDMGEKVQRIKRKPERPIDAEQVKRSVDTLADAARELRRQDGVPERLINWLDETHQEMLEDDNLRLSDPKKFKEKWKDDLSKYADFSRKFNAIQQALYDARNTDGEYRYPEERIREIMGRAKTSTE